ncbi:MAG: polysaccharide lyase beta-sandwich domain-containing protein [Clostridiales bacterium]|nr:polysaccharide lyase beta-sandwich domain-containing protein [Clostridiales bacterium]
MMTLLERLKKIYVERYTTTDGAEAENALSRIEPDGCWRDIDYSGGETAAWQPLTHLRRAKLLAAAYAVTGNAAFARGTLAALHFWLARKPYSANWWHMQIGQQLCVMPILVLLRGALPRETEAQFLQTLYTPQMAEPRFRTGQNLMWFAAQQVVRGVLTENEADVLEGLSYVKSEIRVTDKEGIQRDGSFHQHGAQLYSGGYGTAFLCDAAFWLRVTEGTKFAFEREYIETLSFLLLDGHQLMITGREFDPSASGRQIARTGEEQKAISLLPACDALARANPQRRGELTAFAERIKDGAESLCRNKHFFLSDYMTHHRRDVFVSLKMCSRRTVGTEHMNGENSQAFWLPFGYTNIITHARRDETLYALWDWTLIPGVTAPAAVDKLDCYQSHAAEFVGGASDGVCGVAVMTLDKAGVRAKKSWFFFDDCVAALGADICADRTEEIRTAVNQGFLRGNLAVDGVVLDVGKHTFTDARRVSHDGLEYLLPPGAAVTVRLGSVTGGWHNISAAYAEQPISGDLFSIAIEHGAKPMGENYAYAVFFRQIGDSDGVETAANGKDAQAARRRGTETRGAVFHAPASVTFEDGKTLTADAPCAVLVTKDGVTAANPAAGARDVTLTYGGKSYAFHFTDGGSSTIPL